MATESHQAAIPPDREARPAAPTSVPMGRAGGGARRLPLPPGPPPVSLVAGLRRAGSDTRAQVLRRLQQGYGNRVVQRLLLLQRTQLDTTDVPRFATPSGNFYRFRAGGTHTNTTNRPQFQHPASVMVAYSGAGAGGATVHPAVVAALDSMMTALIAEGTRIDDESMKQAVVASGFRASTEAEGRAYLNALRKTIRQNPDIFGTLTFPTALEAMAITELGFSGSAAHDAFRDEIAQQPGWTAALARQLVRITAGFKAPRGGSTHHSGLVVDINFPFATSARAVRTHGMNREQNTNARRAAAGVWLETYAAGFGFDSYDTSREIWHQEWRDWAGTAADPATAGATSP